ncbi:hypothetical protein [Alkalicoccobacillus murimartini]|uniref:Glucan phosphoethanolaminetransferase (Alkaline phosphatase superfamily) n=1 Tax=Alkalicoccobacillus murimartini TaxID=171685 RepID=A0ABT9YKB1_9BACI|nr:hypothetical protein [Alkalicoccobacillus murimartini]MDQ0208309.1 glucan phosphoethanolaminetransferase (alkaline phosphatase superfamily) [Alkalicoccobacillus murimartini]
MYFLFLAFIGYTLACYFGFGATFLLVGNFKYLETLIKLFRFPKPQKWDEKFLNLIYLCFLFVPHASYRYLEKKYSFIKVKVIYGSVLLASMLVFLGVIMPFLGYIGAFESLER